MIIKRKAVITLRFRAPVWIWAVADFTAAMEKAGSVTGHKTAGRKSVKSRRAFAGVVRSLEVQMCANTTLSLRYRFTSVGFCQVCTVLQYLFLTSPALTT